MSEGLHLGYNAIDDPSTLRGGSAARESREADMEGLDAASVGPQRRSPTPADYHRMPIAQKRTEALARAREPAVTCRICDMQVTTTDLLAHLADRCPGPRDPGPGAKWVNFREALALGVPRVTLSRWTSSGQVRVVGERQDRRYLHRDLALKISQRNGFRRR